MGFRLFNYTFFYWGFFGFSVVSCEGRKRHERRRRKKKEKKKRFINTGCGDCAEKQTAAKTEKM